MKGPNVILEKLGLRNPSTQYTTPNVIENIMGATGLFGTGANILPGQQAAPPMNMSQGADFYDSNASVPNIAKLVGKRRNSPFV